ncbi:MAG: hypothetical protein HUK09_05740, partial [Bacteroidaceae bacterium]|nr:hypothetical protein [Bacteroidaceae bacterium]
MHLDLLRVALRQKAVFLEPTSPAEPQPHRTQALVATMAAQGWGCDEALYDRLHTATDEQIQGLTELLSEVMGLHLNWAPLVKGWLTPTGESRA